jgi:hypothetical protein
MEHGTEKREQRRGNREGSRLGPKPMGKGNREHGTENREQGTKRAVGWGLSLWGGEEESGRGTGLCRNRREEMEMALDMRRWQLQNDMWILALWWRREVCLVHH